MNRILRMTELEKFQELKQKVLLKYQEQYPYFQGNWKSFSSQDILNLIELIEQRCKQTISEKWIYTHLKPEINSKLPRKDMLHILSEFVGFSSWDEFVFEEKNVVPIKNNHFKNWKLISLICVIILVFTFVFFLKKENPTSKTIELNNEFTNEKVKSEEVKVFQVEDSVKKELEIKEGKVQVSNTENKKTKLVIQSPFYKSKTVLINQNNVEPLKTIGLKPDDYAMMLKAFMLSDIKDWQTRKEQLHKILAADLEVLVMLKGDLGIEYFNKKEFSEKLIVPSVSLKKMKVIDIKRNGANEINFIRILQE